MIPLQFEFADTGLVVGSGPTATDVTPHGCTTLDEEGLDVVHHPWEIPGDVNGTKVSVYNITAHLHIVDESLLDADIYLEGPDGDVLGSSVFFNVQTGPDESVSVDGTLEPGTYNIVIRGCAGRGSYEVSGEAKIRLPPVPTPAINATAA